jgi:hypothetical protein
MKKDYVIYAVLAAVFLAGIFLPLGGSSVVERVVEVGAQVGPEHFEHQVFRSGFTQGGPVTATTTIDSTIVLGTGHSFSEDTSLLSMNVGINATVTTMASTSAPLVGLRAGESFTTYFYNASTTAGSTATFAAGTGVDLQEDEGETVIVNGLEVARLTFLKKADTDVILYVEVGQVGD